MLAKPSQDGLHILGSTGCLAGEVREAACTCEKWQGPLGCCPMLWHCKVVSYARFVFFVVPLEWHEAELTC